MDLNPLIAKVAVLRAEARDAHQASRDAGRLAMERQRKLDEAQAELDKELLNQINKLDPYVPDAG